MRNKRRKIAHTPLALEWLSWVVFGIISKLQRCCRANWGMSGLAAANEEPEAPGSDEKATFPTLAAANQFQVVQKDTLFIPFGEYPVTVEDPATRRKADCVQVFDLEAANEIQKSLSGIRWAIAGVMRLLPIYIGHPDVPQFQDKHKDGRAYGWVTGVNAIREDGMELAVKWSRAGQEMIEDGQFMFYSPYWLMRPLGMANSQLRARPVILRSIGLTNQPAIPVPAIAVAGVNEYLEDPAKPAEEPPPPPSLLQRLAEILGLEAALGEDGLLAKVAELRDAVMQAAMAAKADEDADQQKWAAKEAAMQAAFNEKEARVQELTAANDTLASQYGASEQALDLVKTENEAVRGFLAEAVNELVQGGIAAGVIPGGKAGEWVSAFNEDFPGTLAKLRDSAVVVPFGSRTREIATRRPNAQAPSAAFIAAVNEYRKDSGSSWEHAWLHIKRTKPELYSGMQVK